MLEMTDAQVDAVAEVLRSAIEATRWDVDRLLGQVLVVGDDEAELLDAVAQLHRYASSLHEMDVALHGEEPWCRAPEDAGLLAHHGLCRFGCEGVA